MYTCACEDKYLKNETDKIFSALLSTKKTYGRKHNKTIRYNSSCDFIPWKYNLKNQHLKRRVSHWLSQDYWGFIRRFTQKELIYMNEVLGPTRKSIKKIVGNLRSPTILKLLWWHTKKRYQPFKNLQFFTFTSVKE